MGGLDSRLGYVLERTGYRNVEFVDSSSPDVPESERSEIFFADSKRLSYRRATVKVKTNGTVAESETIIDVQHPAVVQVFPPHEEELNGTKFAVLPRAYKPKHTPSHKLVRIDHKNFLAACILTAEGLNAIHAKEVTTLDFKPSNWLLLENCTEPLITDFDKTKKFGALQTDGTPGFVHPIVERYLLAPRFEFPETVKVSEATAAHGLICTIETLLTSLGELRPPYTGLYELREAWEKDTSFKLTPNHIIDVLDRPRRQRRMFIKTAAGLGAAAAFGGALYARDAYADDLLAASENPAIMAASENPSTASLRTLRRGWSRKVDDIAASGFYEVRRGEIPARMLADGSTWFMKTTYAEMNGLTELLYAAAKDNPRVAAAAHANANAQLEAILQTKQRWNDRSNPWDALGEGVYASGLYTAWNETSDPRFVVGLFTAAKHLIESSRRAQEPIRRESKTTPSGHLTMPYANAATSPEKGVLEGRDLRALQTVVYAEIARRKILAEQNQSIDRELLTDIYLPFLIEMCRSIDALHRGDHFLKYSVDFREPKPVRNINRGGISQAYGTLITWHVAELTGDAKIRAMSDGFFARVIEQPRLHYYFNEGPPDNYAEAVAIYAGTLRGYDMSDRMRNLLVETTYESEQWGGAPLARTSGIIPRLERKPELIGGACHERLNEPRSRNVGDTVTDSYVLRSLP